MIVKIFCRYTAWYEFDLTKTNTVLTYFLYIYSFLLYIYSVVGHKKNCFVSVLVGEYK